MPTPKLLDQVRNLIRMRHYSPSTEKTYVYGVEKYILFHRHRHRHKCEVLVDDFEPDPPGSPFTTRRSQWRRDFRNRRMRTRMSGGVGKASQSFALARLAA